MPMSTSTNILDMELDRTSSFSFPGIRNSQNVIIFGVDMNSPVHVDNKRKYILILGKVPT